MSIQPIPPTSAPTTAGQLAARATQNDQMLADLVTDLESRSEAFHGTLAGDVDLNTLRNRGASGTYVIAGANTNPNLPTTYNVPGMLIVRTTTGFDATQTLTWRSGGGTWVREYTGSAWRPWRRIDTIPSDTASRLASLETVSASAFYRRDTIADGTDFDTLRTRASNGAWVVGSTQNYPNRPLGLGEPGTRTAGMLTVVSSGTGDTVQRVTYRFNNGAFQRRETSASTFTEWERIDNIDDRLTDLLERVDALEAGGGGTGDAPAWLLRSAPATTAWEASQSFDFTSYSDGEAYLDWLSTQQGDRMSVLTLGTSPQGRAIRAVQLGDPTKPTFYLIAAQHGDEVMAREAALIFARETARRYLPQTMANSCLVICPTVNVDRINVSRLNSTGTDLNRNWITRTTLEVQAAASVFGTHDVTMFVDSHEGGTFGSMQGVPPGNEIIHPGIIAQGAVVHTMMQQAFIAAEEPFDDYPSAHSLETAMNNVAAYEKTTSYLLESPSLLGADKHSPDPAWRAKLLAIAYRALFDHWRTNLATYSTVKDNAL